MNVYRGMLSQLETRLARMERPPVITMTTDFGQYDGYVGTMKGVIHTLLPDAKVVDISHEVAPQQINEGAFILYRAYRYFPASAVHIAVVDPGVGSTRRPIVLTTHHGTFVGPDNGIFTYILRAEMSGGADGEDVPTGGPAWAGGMWGVAPNWAGDEPVRKRKRGTGFLGVEGAPRAYHLVNSDYWVASISTTFHGRDIFAPVAAHLASGAQPERLGESIPLDSLVKRPIGAPRVNRSGKTTTITGQIVHLDRFGNIITNLPERLLAPLLEGAASITVEIAGHMIKGLTHAYADVREGQPLALIGSENLLEVAIRNSNAAHRMKVRIGDAVRLVVLSSKA
jgi:S-adenosylmethionine hydrolase